MARYNDEEIEVFSLSFLDVLTCGLASVLLLFIITVSSSDTARVVQPFGYFELRQATPNAFDHLSFIEVGELIWWYQPETYVVYFVNDGGAEGSRSPIAWSSGRGVRHDGMPEITVFSNKVRERYGVLVSFIERPGFPPGVQLATERIDADVTVNIGFTVCSAAAEHKISYELLSSEILREPETVEETFHEVGDSKKWDELRVRYDSRDSTIPRWNAVTVKFFRNKAPIVKGLRVN